MKARRGDDSETGDWRFQKLTTQSYTKRANGQSPRRPKDPIKNFYSRLHDTLTTLQKLQSQLPAEVFARFAKAYSQHWLWSIDHGEKPSGPTYFYNEWAEAQTLGAIGIAGSDDLHAARNYQVYESPRERARAVLGFDAEQEVAYG